ncbi:MAG: hypothetical protein V4584_18450 [Verrucomicrobiota bacterium]
MDDRNIRRFTRATRVQNFDRTNAADFAPGGKTAVLSSDFKDFSLISRAVLMNIANSEGTMRCNGFLDRLWFS